MERYTNPTTAVISEFSETALSELDNALLQTYCKDSGRADSEIIADIQMMLESVLLEKIDEVSGS